jgi:hypothetical protein
VVSPTPRSRDKSHTAAAKPLETRALHKTSMLGSARLRCCDHSLLQRVRRLVRRSLGEGGCQIPGLVFALSVEGASYRDLRLKGSSGGVDGRNNTMRSSLRRSALALALLILDPLSSVAASETRDQLTVQHLYDSHFPAVVDNRYFQPIGTSEPPAHRLSGTLQFAENRPSKNRSHQRFSRRAAAPRGIVFLCFDQHVRSLLCPQSVCPSA